MNSMQDELFSVAGQIVVVSGGSRGIGLALAEGFLQRNSTVIITGKDKNNLEKALEGLVKLNQKINDHSGANETGSVDGLLCDVSDTKAIDTTVEKIIKKYGRIDTLINVAGVNRRKPALELSEADYDYIMNINCKGAMMFSLAVGRHMVAARKGSQINIASLNNDKPVLAVAPYAMSKAAMGHMTRSLAMEWGHHGVRVNALAPGFILTDLTRKLWSQPKMQEWGMQNIPLKRLGQPGDMIGTAIFLASPASNYLTGQVIVVDGGFTAGFNWPIDFSQQ